MRVSLKMLCSDIGAKVVSGVGCKLITRYGSRSLDWKTSRTVLGSICDLCLLINCEAGRKACALLQG